MPYPPRANLSMLPTLSCAPAHELLTAKCAHPKMPRSTDSPPRTSLSVLKIAKNSTPSPNSKPNSAPALLPTGTCCVDGAQESPFLCPTLFLLKSRSVQARSGVPQSWPASPEMRRAPSLAWPRIPSVLVQHCECGTWIRWLISPLVNESQSAPRLCPCHSGAPTAVKYVLIEISCRLP